MSEKTVSNVVIRASLDGTEKILGANGLKSLLNYAGLSYLLKNKPDYSLEKSYTKQELSALTSSYYQVLGTSGAKALFRLIGKELGNRTIEVGVFNHLTDFPPDEKFFKMMELYAMATGKGRLYREGDVVIYDNPPCTACDGLEDTTPVCTALNGMFDEFAAWAGFAAEKTVETRCKAMGDDSCRWETAPAR
jgi:predicted hydrocarbon binding protein